MKDRIIHNRQSFYSFPIFPLWLCRPKPLRISDWLDMRLLLRQILARRFQLLRLLDFQMRVSKKQKIVLDQLLEMSVLIFQRESLFSIFLLLTLEK